MKKVIVVLAIIFLSSTTALAQENSGNTGTGLGVWAVELTARE